MYQNYISQKILHFKIWKEVEDYYLLKNLEISWFLTKNLKESYYHLSGDSFIKNNIAYDFRVEISFMSKWKIFLTSKKLCSGITDFQLQQMYSSEVLGKGVCIARMSKRRNYSYNIIQIYYLLFTKIFCSTQ